MDSQAGDLVSTAADRGEWPIHVVGAILMLLS